MCNGVIVFEDTGDLLPDGRIIPPHRTLPDLDLVTEPARIRRLARTDARASGKSAPKVSGFDPARRVRDRESGVAM